MAIEPIKWSQDGLVLLDQTLLPREVTYVTCREVESVAEAIESLRVRGAPAIGIAAAYGVALGARLAVDASPADFRRAINDTIERLARTRPTAVNLFWALGQMRQLVDQHPKTANQQVFDSLLAAADRLLEEDQTICRQIGHNGASLLNGGDRVLTHCNAGGLATGGYGTALGVVYAAESEAKKLKVYADETRPLLQGARLTAWELMQNGVDVTLLCDSAAASLMNRAQIDCVIVGADRIAANGDVANKIGTYPLAVLAQRHKVPFYVAAPVSTLDMDLASGDLIPIEERSAEEVVEGMGAITAPDQVKVFNPAFDVTPNDLVTAIVSERGIARAPFAPVLRQWVENQ